MADIASHERIITHIFYIDVRKLGIFWSKVSLGKKNPGCFSVFLNHLENCVVFSAVTELHFPGVQGRYGISST